MALTTHENLPEMIRGLLATMSELKQAVVELKASKAIEDDAVYTREQACEALQISLPTLDTATKEGRIVCHRVEGMKRYYGSDLKAAMKQIRVIKKAA